MCHTKPELVFQNDYESNEKKMETSLKRLMDSLTEDHSSYYELIKSSIYSRYIMSKRN